MNTRKTTTEKTSKKEEKTQTTTALPSSSSATPFIEQEYDDNDAEDSHESTSFSDSESKELDTDEDVIHLKKLLPPRKTRNDSIEPSSSKTKTIVKDARTLTDLARFYVPDDILGIPTIKQRSIFHISDIFNTIQNSELNRLIREHILNKPASHAWDEIIDGLTLGIIPGEEHIEPILAIGKNKDRETVIVAMVAPYEYKRKATPLMWLTTKDGTKREGITYINLKFIDFTANMEPANILYFANLMHDAIQQKKSVYVHCKAGKGRSPILVATYLSLFRLDKIGATEADSPATRLRKAVAYMQSKRKQVDLHTELLTDADWQELNQHGTLSNVPYAGKLLVTFQTIQLGLGITPNPHDITSLDESADYFATLSFKKTFIDSKEMNGIKFESFNLISNYVSDKETKDTGRAKDFKNFLRQVYTSTDGKWYTQFKNAMNYLHSYGKSGNEVRKNAKIMGAGMNEKYGNEKLPTYQPIMALVHTGHMDNDVYHILTHLEKELELLEQKHQLRVAAKVAKAKALAHDTDIAMPTSSATPASSTASTPSIPSSAFTPSSSAPSTPTQTDVQLLQPVVSTRPARPTKAAPSLLFGAKAQTQLAPQPLGTPVISNSTVNANVNKEDSNKGTQSGKSWGFGNKPQQQ